MKNMKKRILMLMLAALMLTGLFGAITVEAAAPKLLGEEESCYLTASTREYGDTVPVLNLTKTSKITDLKSSAKSVATVKVEKLDGDPFVTYFPKKPGKTTISFKVKSGKKTYSFKYKLTVKKYVNPFKTFKLGSKNYASLFNKDDNVAQTFHDKTAKLTIQMNKGWKLDGINLYDKAFDQKKVKNGAKINLKNLSAIQIILRKAGSDGEYFMQLNVH